ncbi:hypothetical protein [Mucilaginibacter endophyticus]|uniref:hypothetical protein n=1 Tax=Mucilaginibacter endophyticus TaxID=2675003 RepID=UPI000E0D9C0E|nr:hypothetical protein [Mucilaginibacter endophyticus]
MGQLLRINFENQDHSFRILNKEAITRETQIIDLSLDGQSVTIIKEGKFWVMEKPMEGITSDLVNAIAKNIALRFRI